MPPRTSFRSQVGMGQQRGNRASTLMPRTNTERNLLGDEIEKTAEDVTATFEAKFEPSDMRQLALVAHNHMKPAMKEFISTYSEILKKFRITGTQTTMRMCKTLWGEDNPDIEYGLTCTSGPLGGDAQIAALMCMEDLGALIFFVDPLSAHPHQADIDSLGRLANCGNIIVCNNPTSAMSMMHTLKCALEKGNRGMIPSFFETLESPAVAQYKANQELALAAAVASKRASDAGVAPAQDAKPPLPTDPSEVGKWGWLGAHDSDDESSGEDEDIVEELGSSVKVQEPTEIPRARPNRSSQLYGISKPQKKKGLLRSIGKGMKKMVV